MRVLSVSSHSPPPNCPIFVMRRLSHSTYPYPLDGNLPSRSKAVQNTSSTISGTASIPVGGMSRPFASSLSMRSSQSLNQHVRLSGLPTGCLRRSQHSIDHHKGKELAEEEIASPPAETPVESVQDRHSVISLSSDDEPDPSPRRSKRPRPSSADTEPVAPKRKRGRPPGINAKDAEQILSGTKAPTAKRSTRDLRRVARQEEESAVEESSMSASTARPLPPLPRRRGRPPKEPLPHSSPSTDELVLLPKVGETSRKRRSKKHGTTAAEAMDVDEEPSRPPSPFGVPTLLEPQSEKPTDTSSPRVPAHRVRAANPRVKIADDPNLSEVTGVIAVKAKFMKPSTSTNGPTNGESSASSSTRKPGPGRSSSGFLVGGSRLTAQKGKLITVKPTKSLSRDGDADAEPMNNDFPTFELVEEAPQEPPAEPQAPPTGQELLDAAGLNTVAEDLPDFEEDAEGEIDLEYVAEIASSQRYVAALFEAALLFSASRIVTRTAKAPTANKSIVYPSRL